jgi:hypothetical protein
MELGFWTACQTKSNDVVPDLCPVIFKNGKDSLFTLDRTLAPAWAAVWLAGGLVVLYVYNIPNRFFPGLTRNVAATQSMPPSASSSSTVSTRAPNNANGSVRRSALRCLSGGLRMRRRRLRRRRRLCWSRGLRLCRVGGRRLRGNRWASLGWERQ